MPKKGLMIDYEYCTGCHTCHARGRCVIADDFASVVERMLAADGFIFSSPNYMESVSGQMKAFMDRHCDVVHCLRYEGKYSASITAGSHDYGESLIDFMNNFMVKCGATAIGGVGAPILGDPPSLGPAQMKARDLGKELVVAIKEQRRVPKQEAEKEAARAYFAQMFKRSRKMFEHDYQYYLQHGWIKE